RENRLRFRCRTPAYLGRHRAEVGGQGCPVIIGALALENPSGLPPNKGHSKPGEVPPHGYVWKPRAGGQTAQFLTLKTRVDRGDSIVIGDVVPRENRSTDTE